MRVTAGPLTRRRHKRLLKNTKGYRHGLKNLFKRAFQKTMKARTHAYRSRKVKKRDFRSLWIIRINAAIREIDPAFSYSKFICGLRKSGMDMNSGERKWRFRKLKSGKIKGSRCNSNHILTKKSKKRKRHLRSPLYITDADQKRFELLLPNS